MKNYIGSSSGDILSVFELVGKGLEAQLNSIRAALGNERMKIPTFGNKKLFSELYRNITRYALRRIDDEYQRLKDAEDPKKGPLLPCTNMFTSMMGLPCAHRLRWLIERNEAVQLTEIHLFWRINDTPLPFKLVYSFFFNKLTLTTLLELFMSQNFQSHDRKGRLLVVQHSLVIRESLLLLRRSRVLYQLHRKTLQ